MPISYDGVLKAKCTDEEEAWAFRTIMNRILLENNNKAEEHRILVTKNNNDLNITDMS